MICTDCIFAYTDPDDDQDGYSCPFSFQEAFHSNEKCHYPKMYSEMVRKLSIILFGFCLLFFRKGLQIGRSERW